MYKSVICPKCGVDWTWEAIDKDGYCRWATDMGSWLCERYDEIEEHDRKSGCNRRSPVYDWIIPKHIQKWKERLTYEE